MNLMVQDSYFSDTVINSDNDVIVAGNFIIKFESNTSLLDINEIVLENKSRIATRGYNAYYTD